MTESYGHRRVLSRIRWGGALVAAAATLAMVSLPGVARAEGPGNDQVSGSGPTASSVQVSWIQGLLDNTNTPIASASADRTNQSSEWWFLYKQFQNLKVTISQTQDLGHQGVTVSWSGGTPTSPTSSADFLQMMECYGDSSSGPNPEQCEFGSFGMISSLTNTEIGSRSGSICSSTVPSVTSPPRARDGSAICDTQEPSDPSHVAPCPASGCPASPTTYTIPFAPVTDPTKLDYTPGSTTYFSPFNTDEVQYAVTGQDGTGQQHFETLTGVQAPGLGCGQADAGQPRGCWLVIVPRGEYEPNGLAINPNATTLKINDSPLSATNWAQRIQIHLGFAPVQAFCPIGTLERGTVGTQLITRAMQSWQLALNHAANCTKVYGYSATIESTSTSQLDDPTSGVGLAFTSIPIGSEATRSGGSPPGNLPPILYAPVAVAALGFGFNINITGYDATPVKLTPLLLAKALTQSYRTELPDYFPPQSMPGPAWSLNNPVDIAMDPAFQALNPSAPADPTGPISPLLVEDHSAVNQQAWQWVQASSAATTWLGGTPDAADHNMTVDPDYQALNLGKSPATDWFPRAYKACLDAGVAPGSSPPKKETMCTLDLLPYTNSFDSGAATVLGANHPGTSTAWATAGVAPDGTNGWWLPFGVESIGNILMWTFADTPDIAAYGLVPAQLCGDSGSNCVGPTSDSVTTALSNAKADSSGLLHVDPANPGAGGYPLVDVIYAAVPTNQSPDALNDYAKLISYAAGAGQTIGADVGDLPPGYLPLTPALQSQAQAVVTQLQGLATASPSPSSSSSASPTPAATTSSPAGQLGGNGSTTTPASTTGTGTATTGGTGTTGGGTTAAGGGTSGSGGGTGGATHPAVPAPSPGASLPAAGTHPAPTARSATAAGGPVISLPAAQPAAGTTGSTPVGIVRWVLIALIIAGGVCAVLATVLRSRFSLTWPPWSWAGSRQTRLRPPKPWSRREKPR